jgi:hypothetical protein
VTIPRGQQCDKLIVVGLDNGEARFRPCRNSARVEVAEFGGTRFYCRLHGPTNKGHIRLVHPKDKDVDPKAERRARGRRLAQLVDAEVVAARTLALALMTGDTSRSLADLVEDYREARRTLLHVLGDEEA